MLRSWSILRKKPPVGPSSSSYAAWLADRSYSSTAVVMSEAVQQEDGGGDSSNIGFNLTREEKKRMAKEYAERRLLYKKQVRAVRLQYIAEVAELRKKEEARKAEEEASRIRAKLERQRRKNMKSVRNAMREEEKRKEREAEWQEELRQTRARRDLRKERFRKARQMIVDELEKEAHLWLITPEEVDAAFTPEAIQELWSFPRSVLGAPDPSNDSHFWNQECHTWRMAKTYPTKRELMLQALLDEVYEETNIDPEYWTEDRLAERKEREEKAKLRALIRREGRKSLLRRQTSMLMERHKNEAIPSSAPVPSVRILANEKAMEKEGVMLLKKDSKQFFVFEETGVSREDEETGAPYMGPSLGAPIRMKDPVRDDNGGFPFPRVVGQFPKEDTRTEAQKKRDQREEMLRAATMEQQEEDDMELDDSESKEYTPIDWDAVYSEEDVDDEEAGLHDVPRSSRWTEEELLWIKEQLEKKLQHFQDQEAHESSVEGREQFTKEKVKELANQDSGEWIMPRLFDGVHQVEAQKLQTVPQEQDANDFSGASKDENKSDIDGPIELKDDPSAEGIDAKTVSSVLEDMGEGQRVLASLSPEQLNSLEALGSLDEVASDERKTKLETISGLTQEQIAVLLKLADEGDFDAALSVQLVWGEEEEEEEEKDRLEDEKAKNGEAEDKK